MIKILFQYLLQNFCCMVGTKGKEPVQSVIFLCEVSITYTFCHWMLGVNIEYTRLSILRYGVIPPRWLHGQTRLFPLWPLWWNCKVSVNHMYIMWFLNIISVNPCVKGMYTLSLLWHGVGPSTWVWSHPGGMAWLPAVWDGIRRRRSYCGDGLFIDEHWIGLMRSRYGWATMAGFVPCVAALAGTNYEWDTSRARLWLRKGLITTACDCLPPLPLTTAQCFQCYVSNCIGSLCNPHHSNQMALSTSVFAQHHRNPTLSGNASDSALQITTKGPLLHWCSSRPYRPHQFASSSAYQWQPPLSKVAPLHPA